MSNRQSVGGVSSLSPWQRAVAMIGLVVAGEAIFGLPFHVARFFRPTLLEVFDFTNTELGAAQSVYGVTAMLAYFPGGPLADRFQARHLLVASLVSTAAGGLYMASIPSYRGTSLLFAFWGVTTILLFWAALIRATRDWGSAEEQGRAYGLLDGGRGLLAAAMASLGVLLFHLVFPEDAAMVTPQQRREALRLVIYGYSIATLGAALLVWLCVQSEGQGVTNERHRGRLRERILLVLRLPAVWLQALIVVCAYVGFKGVDNYPLFAVQGYGVDEVMAAEVATLGAWMRPVAAVSAGFLADRIRASRVLGGAFLVLLVSDLYFALVDPIPGTTWILVANVLMASAAVFALRGVYFALFQESRVDTAVTGTAVGLVSVIGFTPDIFVGFFGGWLLDRSPGVAGHQHYFVFLAAFAALGLLATLGIIRLNRHEPTAR